MGNVYQVSDDKELTKVLKQMKDGDVLKLRPNEYRGFSINKNISITTTVKNQYACIVDSKSPVIDIKSKQVHLENLQIEFCDNQGNTEKGVAVRASKKCQIQTKNVIIGGAVQGITGEEDKWDYPCQLQLGNMLPNQAYMLKIVLSVPCKCKATSKIADIKISPQELLPGLNTMTFHIEQLRNKVDLWGYLIIESNLFMRKIVLCGHVVAFDEDNENEYVTDNSILWQPQLEPEPEPEPVISPEPEPEPVISPEPEQGSEPEFDSGPTKPRSGKTGRKIMPNPFDFPGRSPFTKTQADTSHDHQSAKNKKHVETKHPNKEIKPEDTPLGKKKPQDISKITDFIKKVSPAIESESKTDYDENNTQESLKDSNGIPKDEAEPSKGRKRVKSIPNNKIWV